MTTQSSSLYLITPLVAEPEAFGAALRAACGEDGVAAVLLRLAEADERTLINRVKRVAPIVQDAGVALLIASGGDADLVTIAGRGGADGVHVGGATDLGALRDRLKGDRILGVGGLRSKHDAMTAGEAGVDYVMFGEPRADDSIPDFDAVLERAGWWAEIFATPCAAFAPSLEAAAELAATGAEFLALGDAVWLHPSGPAEAVRQARMLLDARIGA